MSRALAAAASLAALALAACGGDEPASETNATAPPPAAAKAKSSGVLAGSLPLLNGEPQRLTAYRDDVVLVVNTASECGFSPQFETLEELYREKRKQGFVILGFPADDIVGQEPRSNKEIAEYCEANFGVSFPMFAKSNVVDDPVNPLFVSLGRELGAPTYNFNKYLLAPGGRPVERYDQYTEPDDPALTSRIDALLAARSGA